MFQNSDLQRSFNKTTLEDSITSKHSEATHFQSIKERITDNNDEQKHLKYKKPLSLTHDHKVIIRIDKGSNTNSPPDAIINLATAHKCYIDASPRANSRRSSLEIEQHQNPSCIGRHEDSLYEYLTENNIVMNIDAENKLENSVNSYSKNENKFIERNLNKSQDTYDKYSYKRIRRMDENLESMRSSSFKHDYSTDVKKKYSHSSDSGYRDSYSTESYRVSDYDLTQTNSKEILNRQSLHHTQRKESSSTLVNESDSLFSSIYEGYNNKEIKSNKNNFGIEKYERSKSILETNSLARNQEIFENKRQEKRFIDDLSLLENNKANSIAVSEYIADISEEDLLTLIKYKRNKLSEHNLRQQKSIFKESQSQSSQHKMDAVKIHDSQALESSDGMLGSHAEKPILSKDELYKRADEIIQRAIKNGDLDEKHQIKLYDYKRSSTLEKADLDEKHQINHYDYKSSSTLEKGDLDEKHQIKRYDYKRSSTQNTSYNYKSASTLENTDLDEKHQIKRHDYKSSSTLEKADLDEKHQVKYYDSKSSSILEKGDLDRIRQIKHYDYKSSSTLENTDLDEKHQIKRHDYKSSSTLERADLDEKHQMKHYDYKSSSTQNTRNVDNKSYKETSNLQATKSYDFTKIENKQYFKNTEKLNDETFMKNDSFKDVTDHRYVEKHVSSLGSLKDNQRNSIQSLQNKSDYKQFSSSEERETTQSNKYKPYQYNEVRNFNTSATDYKEIPFESNFNNDNFMAQSNYRNISSGNVQRNVYANDFSTKSSKQRVNNNSYIKETNKKRNIINITAQNVEIPKTQNVEIPTTQINYHLVPEQRHYKIRYIVQEKNSSDPAIINRRRFHKKKRRLRVIKKYTKYSDTNESSDSTDDDFTDNQKVYLNIRSKKNSNKKRKKYKISEVRSTNKTEEDSEVSKQPSIKTRHLKTYRIASITKNSQNASVLLRNKTKNRQAIRLHFKANDLSDNDEPYWKVTSIKKTNNNKKQYTTNKKLPKSKVSYIYSKPRSKRKKMIKININNNKNGIENPVYVNRGPKCVLFFKQQKHAVIEYIENLNKEKQETNHEESKTKVEKKTKKKLRKRRKIYASSAANTSETSVKKKIEQLSHFSNDSENKNDSKSLQFQRKDEKSSEQLKKNNFELDRSTVRRSSSIKMRRSSSKSFSSTTTTTTSTSDMVQESSYESHQKETYNKQLQTEKGNSRRRAASLSFRTSFKRESLYTNRDACCSCENQKKTNFIGDRRIKKYLKMSSNESTSNKEREYKITTYTGVHRWAGTDASIYITLTGTNGKGKEHRLKGKGKYFEKGSIDTFTVKDQDLGFISKIHVRNDNKGMAPGWLLNKVVVKEDDKEYEFSYGNWLFKGKNYSLDADIDVDGFPVLGINPHIEENSENHHTDKFILSEDNIILRRGQTFKLTLLLARDYKPAADPFSFTLMTTKKPQQMLKTLVHVNEVMPKDFNAAKKRGKEWIFKISDATDLRKIEVEIFIPPTAMPGHYTVYVNDEDGVCYEPAAPVYILFNPWCPEDDVYMESEEEIKEYVLRQTGKVYVGSSLHPRGRTWHFGQFEEVSLLATLKMLEEMKAKNRDSPIHVSRFLTSKVNSIDNNGVLEGNWSGDYSDGHSPTSWISTTAILEKYLEANEPVKYGQCWVFSAIVVTVLRCLGIPCRSVTNFSSAHDSDGSCSNDKYLDENGEEIEDMSSDSVWNFHVWNDAWMARPDLQPGYGGWQAIDATPQERSQGLFQMGPAPLAAVKEGEIDVLYDVGFCLAEVNADSMIWEKNKETDEWEVIYRNKTLVGKLVCTKAVGNTKMEDVTECYKFKEGSVLERASIKNALLKTKNPAVKVTRKDISLEIVPLKKHISCGGDITIDVKIVNESEDEHPMSVMVGGQVIRYDGVAQAKLEMHTEETSVEGGGEKKIRIKVPASHYMPYMSEETQVRFTATGKVSDTSQFVRGEEIIDIVKPDLVIEKYEEKLRAGVESEMLVTFTNPLDVELTECEMYMDGTIIKNRIYFNNMENVAAKGKMEQKILYIPENDAKERKDKKVNISFTSKELGGVSVQHAIPVSPPCTCVE